MTIPHPPPYGLSSVTRCFPLAKFLISMADTRILFRSIALLIIPCSQKGLNISGNIVRAMKFIPNILPVIGVRIRFYNPSGNATRIVLFSKSISNTTDSMAGISISVLPSFVLFLTIYTSLLPVDIIDSTRPMY
jgi:hypothetical protein